jgi:hypothetical protein
MKRKKMKKTLNKRRGRDRSTSSLKTLTGEGRKAFIGAGVKYQYWDMGVSRRKTKVFISKWNQLIIFYFLFFLGAERGRIKDCLRHQG